MIEVKALVILKVGKSYLIVGDIWGDGMRKNCALLFEACEGLREPGGRLAIAQYMNRILQSGFCSFPQSSALLRPPGVIETVSSVPPPSSRSCEGRPAAFSRTQLTRRPGEAQLEVWDDGG